jgi:HAD superfamily hydrolase (TIGR01457 family)
MRLLRLTDVRALLIDVDGVIYYDDMILPGVNELLDFLRQHEIVYAFVTNGTRNRPRDHRLKLSRFGIDVQGAPVFTAAMATADYLLEVAPGARVYVIGGDGFRRELQERAGCTLDEKRPQFVVVGFTEDFDYRQLRTACRAIYRGARLIVGDPDVNDPHPDGPVPGSGAFAAAIEAATGCAGIRIGKPNPALYEMALRELGVAPRRTAVLGDRLDSDIAGGLAVGLGTILVLSGITQPDDVESSTIKPDVVVNDLHQLRNAWTHALANQG